MCTLSQVCLYEVCCISVSTLDLCLSLGFFSGMVLLDHCSLALAILVTLCASGLHSQTATEGASD
jgi:hypothetical protein